MARIEKTEAFAEWLRGLKDSRAIARIAVRIDRLAAGNPGDVRPVGDGVSELRIDYGPGYRVYYIQRGSVLVILLCGGDESSQRTDVLKARSLAKEWKD